MERELDCVENRQKKSFQKISHIVDNASYYVPHTEDDTAKSRSPEDFYTTTESLGHIYIHKRGETLARFHFLECGNVVGTRECDRPIRVLCKTIETSSFFLINHSPGWSMTVTFQFSPYFDCNDSYKYKFKTMFINIYSYLYFSLVFFVSLIFIIQ